MPERTGPAPIDFTFSADDPLSPQELALSYCKYYYLPVKPISPLAAQILSKPAAPEACLHAREAWKLFLPGYLENELGYCVFPDGTGYGASYCFMPGVTVEMIEWYMNWQFIQPPSVPKEQGNLRYKIWCPGAHWSTGGVDEESNLKHAGKGKYASLTLAERSRYTNDFMIHKSPVDDSAARNAASSIDPVREFRVDPAIADRPDFGYACGASHSGLFTNIHYYRYSKALGGTELRSRYWYGWGLNEKGEVVSNIESLPPQDMNELKGCVIHNLLEYGHLAEILPALYAEESWKPIDAY